MTTVYRTARKKIASAFKDKLKVTLTGTHPYHTNIFNNASDKIVFLDEIEQYPKVCVVAGDETRQYQPGGFKWRFLLLSIRAYVKNEEDAQEELSLLLEDIEKIIDESDQMVYDDTVDPIEQTTQMTIQSITTDEGAIEPLGIGEIVVEVRY